MPDTAKSMLPPSTLALESNVFKLKLRNQWSGEYQATKVCRAKLEKSPKQGEAAQETSNSKSKSLDL